MLAYTDIGEGIPIVFVHGLGSRKEAWAHQQPLAANYRLISIDLRAHGETEINDQITIKNMAEDIVELLEFLKIKAYICGLSLGGIIAQEVYKQRSDLVRGLILASTTAFIPKHYTHAAIGEATKSFNDGSLIDKIVERGLVNKAFSEVARDAFHIRDKYLEVAESGIGLDYYPTLRKVKKPVLLIGGLWDKVIPIPNLYWMLWCMPHAITVVLNNAGHLINIEQAGKFNQSIHHFIEGVGV